MTNKGSMIEFSIRKLKYIAIIIMIDVEWCLPFVYIYII